MNIDTADRVSQNHIVEYDNCLHFPNCTWHLSLVGNSMDTMETDRGEAIQDECNDDLGFSRNPLLRDRETILLSKAISHSIYDETTDLRFIDP